MQLYWKGVVAKANLALGFSDTKWIARLEDYKYRGFF